MWDLDINAMTGQTSIHVTPMIIQYVQIGHTKMNLDCPWVSVTVDCNNIGCHIV